MRATTPSARSRVTAVAILIAGQILAATPTSADSEAEYDCEKIRNGWVDDHSTITPNANGGCACGGYITIYSATYRCETSWLFSEPCQERMVMRATKYSTLAPDYPTLAQIVRKLGACGLSVGMVACIIGAVGGSTLLAIPSFGLSATAGAAVVGVCGAAGLAALNDCLAQCSLTSCQVAPGPVERFGDRIRTCKRDRL